MNPDNFKDRVKVGRIVWEQTNANIVTFACTYAIMEHLGNSLTWDQVLTAVFIAHKMHDTNPYSKRSEFSKAFGIQVDTAVEMQTLFTLNFCIPRVFFLSDMYALGKTRNVTCQSMDTAARIAILYKLYAVDRDACIVACLAAAAKWDGAFARFVRRVPCFDKPLCKSNLMRFFARLLNARAKLE